MIDSKAIIKLPRLPQPKRISEQLWPEGTVPAVSVFNWSYNHIEFIHASIESILMQETTFPVEIVIHDDASTDGTREIIRKYEAKHPQIFRNIHQTENQWSQGKSVMKPMQTAPQGKFVALTHGDDYWTSPHKLQKQYDFLEANPDYAYCATRFLHVPEHEPEKAFPSDEHPENGRLEDILVRNYTHTSTLMFRRDLAVYPDDVVNVTSADWYLCCLLASKGRIGFINEIMSAYRLHDGGVMTGMPLERRYQAVRESLDEIHRMLEQRYRHLRAPALAGFRINLMQNHLLRRQRWDWFKALGHFIAVCATSPHTVDLRSGLRMLLSHLRGGIRNRYNAIKLTLARLRIRIGVIRRKIGLGPLHRSK